MPFPTPPTVRASWFNGGRYDIESTLQELILSCLARDVPNATLETNFLSVGFPDGAPTRCDFLTVILVNKNTYWSFDEGVNWILVHDPATGVSESFQTGTIICFGGAVGDVPSDWLVCDGSEADRTTYSDLFTRLSTSYGVGNGTTTFNLPDMRGRTPTGTNDSGMPNGVNGSYTTRNEGDEFGAETHTLIETELPSHSHSISYGANGNADDNGSGVSILGTSLSDGNSVGGDGSHENQIPSITGIYIIKT